MNGNTDEGAAYIFTGGGSAWSLAQELTETTVEGSSQDYFGYSVAISGSTVLVGARNSSLKSHYQGAAYVYTSSGSTWTQSATLTANDGAPDDLFGHSVAISGSTILVSAPGHAVSGNSSQGAAYVFTGSGSTWTESDELTATDGAAWDLFGWSVRLSGETIIVGAPNHTVNGNSTGSAYVFTGSGSTWILTSEPPALDGAAGDSFGSSVGLSGPTVLVGAIGHEVGTQTEEGAAYVFSSAVVQLQGSAVGADTWGGGSLSEPCECSGITASAHASAGDPVDTATGDFHETATDLSLPGAGVPLAFTRTYDAQAAQAEAAAGSPAPPLGYGWSDNLGMSLAYNSSNQTATITEENGAQTAFTPYVSGTSPAWCSGSTNFCATAPRIEATLNQNSDGTWTYARATGGQETFTFSSAGALSSIADSAGDTLSSSAYSPGSGQTSLPVVRHVRGVDELGVRA